VPDPRTIYRVGSVTKAFTALMLLQLVENGTVRLTDPVERYLPEIRQLQGIRAGAPPITLLQLATHTAGVAAEPEGTGFDQGPVDGWEQRLIAALPATSCEYEPGTRFSYSNMGYAILALALSRAANRPYVDYVRERITGPLGMVDTGFVLSAEQRPRLAVGYLVENGQASTSLADAGHAGRGYKVPVGGLYTTLEDLAKFLAFQMGDGPASVLRRDSLDAASRRLITVDRNMGEAYGTGFQLFTNGDVVLQGHAGGMPGYRALEVFERESRTGFIVLRNAVGGRFGDPVFMVFRALPAESE
jgi:CubicO group peptidase (beta-lactamase class C family)